MSIWQIQPVGTLLRALKGQTLAPFNLGWTFFNDIWQSLYAVTCVLGYGNSSAISLPILVFLALLVLELFTMYATDRQTDGQKQRLMPPTLRAGA